MPKADTGKLDGASLVLGPAVAAGAVVAAFAVRQVLLVRFGITLPPFSTLYPAVMLVALFLGLWNGIWATSLATVLAGIWIFEPAGELRIAQISDSIALGLFFGVCVCISVVADRYRRNQRRVAALEHERALRATRQKLEESSADRRLALEAADQGAWEYDLETGKTNWDECCRKGFGFSANESLNYELVMARISDEDRPAVEVAVKEAVAGKNGVRYRQEFRVTWPDGTVHWIASHGRVYFEGEGDARRASRLIGVNTDITERKRAESALKTALERFYVILSNLNCGVLLVTNDDRIEYANPAFCVLFGLKEAPSELVGLDAAGMIGKIRGSFRDPDSIHHIQEIAARAEPVLSEEVPMRNGGTSIRDFVPLVVDGKTYGRLWVHTDITERKQAENELVEARLQAERSAIQLRTIFDNVEERLYVCDHAGNLIMANDVARQTYGHGEDAMAPPVPDMGKLIAVYDLDGRPLPEPEWPISRILRGEHVRSTEVRVRFKGTDQDRVLSCNGSSICDENGNIRMAVITSSDITERKRAEDELQQSKREWERTFNSVPDLIAILDNQQRIVRVNQAMAQRLGKTPEECIGLSCFASVHGLMAPIPNCPHVLTLKDCCEHVAEVQEERLGGDFLVSTTPLVDERGAMTGVVHVARNITERKRAEEELKKLNRTLRAISNSNQALLHATDEPAFLDEVCRIIREDCGHALVWIGYAGNDENKTVRPAASAGFDEGYLEAMGVTWGDGERGRGPVGRAIRTGQPHICRDMLTDPAFSPWREAAGKRGFASVLSIPLMEPERALGAITIYSLEQDAFSRAEVDLLRELAGDVEFGIQTLRTRAAHSRAEEALRKSEMRFRSVLDDSRDVIYRLNLQTNRYEYISPSAETMMGFSREDLAALDFNSAVARVHPDDLATVWSSSERLVDAGKEELEYRMRTKDGGYLWLSSRSSLVKDEFGRPLYRDGTVRDITAKKLAEEALLRSEKLASVGRMAATISHEINNPLAAVTNLLFLAQWNQDLPDAVRRNLEMADAELKRIAHITQQSLGFYRESNAPAIVGVDVVLESAIDLMKSKIKTKGAVIESESDGAVEVNAVAGELRQVFANLLANSLDAIDDGGRVRLHVCQGPNFEDGHSSVQVVVADNGKGISESSQHHIFEPFFTTKGTVGTGLGLWVTKQIIEKHHGTIGMSSCTKGPNRGTVFTVVLPVAAANPGGIKSDAVLGRLST